jgi:hypothetical protein
VEEPMHDWQNLSCVRWDCIANKGNDSDSLRKNLKEFNIDRVVTQHKKPKMSDGRKLMRYRKRWKIEQTFS